MGKRSQFEKRPRGFYETPPEAVKPLLAHLPAGLRIAEPCDGAGALTRALQDAGHLVVWRSDIEPQGGPIGVAQMDALTITRAHLDNAGAQLVVTNPPWPLAGKAGYPTLGILEHLAGLRPTWALLPSDFGFNAYLANIEHALRKIVAVGRVSWEGNGVAGKDNAAWYLFDEHTHGRARFYGRAKR